MRSATPRPPKRYRYTPQPAQTRPGRYTPRHPQHADLRCYGVADGHPADTAGRLLGAHAQRARPGRYTPAAVTPWR